MAMFTRATKLEPGAHGARCAGAKAVHHTVGISRQKNSGYNNKNNNNKNECHSNIIVDKLQELHIL